METVEQQEAAPITGRWEVPVILGVCVAVLSTVYAAEHLAGLAPCPLCIYQRWPWWAAAGLATVALVLRPGRAGTGAVLMAIALVLIAGAGIAAFHIGVEQHWWAGTSSCAAVAAPGSFAELQSMMARPAPRCDEPAWTLFGVSMAGYNLLVSLVTVGFALYYGASRLRHRNAGAHG